MKLDPIRLARQRAIAKKWWDSGGVGSFLAATGFGKAYTAMIIISAMKKKNPSLKTLVAVPGDYLRDQWRVRAEANNLSGVRVDTVHNLVNQSNDTDLLILDELHSYTSPVFSTIFQTVKYTYLLGMTATLREDPARNQILHTKCPIFDEVTLQECLEKGWVSPFVIYNYALELNESERRYYNELSGKFNKAFGIFGHDLNLAFQCLNNELTRARYARRIKWSEKAVLIQAVNMVRNMKERKQFLYHYPPLFDKAIEIINEYGEGRKIITFSQSTDSADQLTDMLGERAMSYHSKLKTTMINGKKYRGKKLKNKVIELYKSGEIDVINTAKALDQGVDIEDIDTSLVCSGTASILQAIQRTGRQIRAKPGKQACEINLFIRDTQSEKWLRKRQRKHPSQTIRYISEIGEIAL